MLSRFHSCRIRSQYKITYQRLLPLNPAMFPVGRRVRLVVNKQLIVPDSNVPEPDPNRFHVSKVVLTKQIHEVEKGETPQSIAALDNMTYDEQCEYNRAYFRLGFAGEILLILWCEMCWTARHLHQLLLMAMVVLIMVVVKETKWCQLIMDVSERCRTWSMVFMIMVVVPGIKWCHLYGGNHIRCLNLLTWLCGSIEEAKQHLQQAKERLKQARNILCQLLRQKCATNVYWSSFCGLPLSSVCIFCDESPQQRIPNKTLGPKQLWIKEISQFFVALVHDLENQHESSKMLHNDN
jgi:hypothetical protein